MAPPALGESVHPVEHMGETLAAAERSFVLIISEPQGGGDRTKAPGRARRLVGCGIALDAAGYVLTTSSVVEAARNVTVVPVSGGPLLGHVIGVDPLWDVAVIQVPGGMVPGVPMGDSDSLAAGAWVTMLGSDYGSGPVACLGVVTGRVPTRPEWGGEVLRVFAPIRPGDTGAVLLDERGVAVGMVSATLDGSGGIVRRTPKTRRRAALSNYVEGIAIPMNEALTAAWQLIEKGPIDRGYLGVQIQSLTHPLAASLDWTSAWAPTSWRS